MMTSDSKPKRRNPKQSPLTASGGNVVALPTKGGDRHKSTAKALSERMTGVEPEARLVRGQGHKAITEKQERFALTVAEGSTLSAAYRLAYDAEGSKPETVWARASELADNSKVKARIAFHVERIERERPHDNDRIRRRLREFLLETVDNAKESATARLRAAELLGKVAGVSLFSEAKVSQAQAAVDQAEMDKLKEKIEALLGPKLLVSNEK